MFHGSLPTAAQQIIMGIVSEWKCSDIFIGCSGNFTMERMLHPLHCYAMHSNDITIYSTALGCYLAEQPFHVSLNPAYPEYQWLTEYITNPADLLATIMLSTRFLEGIGKTNLYYNRMRGAFEAQWSRIHNQTASKLHKIKMQIDSFYCGDVVDWSLETDKNMGFICFPPFFSGDYEGMFSKLEKLFIWEKPQYPEMDSNRRDMLFENMMSHKYWCFGAHEPHEALTPHLKGLCQTTNRGVPIYIYASNGHTRIVMPHQEIEPVLFERLSPGKVIGKEMSLQTLTEVQFRTLRSLYMNIKIKPGQAALSIGVFVALSIGVFVDGILIGVYAMNPPEGNTHFAGKVPEPLIYLLSDFSIAPTDYSKLSKLVLYAALSQESKFMAERMIRRRVNGIITTAFSNNPISMKYRGVFELISKQENRNPDHGDHKYMLNYGSAMGRWTLKEGLDEWKKKHGQKK